MINPLSRFFKDTKPSGQLLALLLLLVVAFVLTGVVSVLVSDLCNASEARSSKLLLLSVQSVFVFLVPALFFSVLFYDKPGEFLQTDFRCRQWVKGGVAMVALLLLIPVTGWLGYWNSGWHLPTLLEDKELALRAIVDRSEQELSLLLSVSDVVSLLANICVVAMLPAICEEFFFRGCVQQVLLRRIRNPHVAVFLSALVFSLAHGDFWGLVPRCVLGVALGYLFYYSGSIVVNICAHFANNALIVFLSFLNDKGTITIDVAGDFLLPWWLVIIATAMSAVLFWTVCVPNGLRRTKSKGK